MKILKLKDEARLEIYQYIDKNLKPLPKNDDGSFNEFASGFNDNDVDALRHAYVSGVYTMEYNEKVAEILGRLNEMLFIQSSNAQFGSENMDLWINFVGRKYGKRSNNREELIKFLIKALNDGELIINPKDDRKYGGEGLIKTVPKGLVIVVKETESGENIEFLDIGNKKVMDKSLFVSEIEAGNYPDYEIRLIKGVKTPFSKRDRFYFNNLG